MLDLAFDDRGQGDAVVLLPPFPFDRRAFAGTAAALAGAGFRAITVDYPGFGAGAAPRLLPAAFSIADIAEQAAGLLDRLALATATLVGLSMGGYVALAFAARFPERLRALVLADTRAAADSEDAREGRARALEAIATRGVDAYLSASLPRLLAPNAPPATLAAARALAETRPEALAAGLTALRDRPDRSAVARAIVCPCLVVVGAEDQVTPAAELRDLAGSIRGARFVEIPAAGHLSQLEAPDIFNRAVLDFMAGLPGPRSTGRGPAPPGERQGHA